jgi:hypothetical protein
LDVRVAGKWDGILVVDGAGMCIGIYVHRRIEEYPLPFAADAIEDIRHASFMNRLLAAFPFDLWDGAVLTIVVLSPIALLLGSFVSPLFALFSVVACAAAIYVMYLAPGFPFIRLPAALLGFAQVMSGGMLLLRMLLARIFS